MAITAPTAAEFKARFPEFASQDDTYLDTILAEATLQVGEDWDTVDQKNGMLYAAAHMISSASDQIAGGGIKSISIAGAIAIAYRDNPLAANSKSELARTEYGIQYQRILKRNAGGPVIV